MAEFEDNIDSIRHAIETRADRMLELLSSSGPSVIRQRSVAAKDICRSISCIDSEFKLHQQTSFEFDEIISCFVISSVSNNT